MVSTRSHRTRYRFSLTYRRYYDHIQELLNSTVTPPTQIDNSPHCSVSSQVSSTSSQVISSSVSQDLSHEGGSGSDIELTGNGVGTYYNKLQSVFRKYETVTEDCNKSLAF